MELGAYRICSAVSTRSRPKAAGAAVGECSSFQDGFNTQPPEGGWDALEKIAQRTDRFQHAAARRRLGAIIVRRYEQSEVSTRSRPKAAGHYEAMVYGYDRFNTQPPEGGWLFFFLTLGYGFVSTRSRPKAAGLFKALIFFMFTQVSTRSRPKAAG